MFEYKIRKEKVNMISKHKIMDSIDSTVFRDRKNFFDDTF